MFHADRPPNLISELTPYRPYFAEKQTTLEGFTHNILGPRHRIKPAGVPRKKFMLHLVGMSPIRSLMSTKGWPTTVPLAISTDRSPQDMNTLLLDESGDEIGE